MAYSQADVTTAVTQPVKCGCLQQVEALFHKLPASVVWYLNFPLAIQLRAAKEQIALTAEI